MGITPFFALYGKHPRWIIQQNVTTKVPTPAVFEESVNQLENLNGYFKSEIFYPDAIQAKQADRDHLPATAYQVGDGVWLLHQDIQTAHLSSKLDIKRLGLFRITQQISNHVYQVDLPASIKCHPAFHVSLQQPATINLLVGKKQPATAPIFVDDHIEFQVEKIVDLKVVRKNLKYLVRWVGYDELTWEPAELL